MFTIIVNTVAGHGKALKVAARVEAWLKERGFEYAVTYTEYAGHAVELARACGNRGDSRVFCVGGDGTVFEAANGLAGSDTSLGVIPGGTGNDFARSLGLPKDPVAVMDTLLSAPVRAVNMCKLNDRVFLNVCGAGFDVEVVEACNRVKHLGQGMLPYLYGVLHTLFTYKSRDFTIELDGEPRQVSLLLVAVANGQYIGGGMHVAPMARLDDDLLDVIMVRPMSRLRILRLLPKLIDGSYIALTDVVQHRRCRSVRVSSPGMRMQADGEIAEIEDARIDVSDQRLLMLMP
jgi:YegS/Rv2252/BmrU family lipid kinase